jgi:hypothetical protein
MTAAIGLIDDLAWVWTARGIDRLGDLLLPERLAALVASRSATQALRA